MLKPVVVAHSSVPGGAEAYLVRLYSSLAAGTAAPTLLGSIPLWEQAGLRQVTLELGPKWGGRTVLSGVARLPRERAQVLQGMAERPVDFFHMQFKREQIGFTEILSKKAPVIWTEHGQFLKGPKGALLGLAYRAAARKAEVIICVSQEVAESTRRVVGKGPRIEVIENSVDTNLMRPPTPTERLAAREALGVAGRAPVLLWIGRLHQTKRADFAIELAKSWHGHTLIAGDGPLRTSLERAAEDIPGAKVLGHVEDPSLVYAAADVMAFTSTGASEGYPTTTMVESAAHGVPIVTDRRSGASRIVLAAGGDIVVDGSDAASWVEALSSSLNSESRSRVRRWALSHDIDYWKRRHMEVFDSVLAARNRDYRP